MKKYKTVAAPAAMSVNRKNSIFKAVEAYEDIINNEAADGWELEMIQQIPMVDEPGCLASLFGKTTEITYINMLIFSKDSKDFTIKKTRNTIIRNDDTDEAEISGDENDENKNDTPKEDNKEDDYGHGVNYVAEPASHELIEEYNRLYKSLNDPLISLLKKEKIKKRIEEIKSQIWS